LELDDQGGLNQSFTELLIQYVDRESKPKPNITFSVTTDKKSDKALVPNHQYSPPLSQSSTLATSSILGNNDAAPGTPTSSNSAIQFFNNNSLTNRNIDAQQQLNATREQNKKTTMTNLSSPETAETFLEQILKK
jgi:hypothetical protein